MALRSEIARSRFLQKTTITVIKVEDISAAAIAAVPWENPEPGPEIICTPVIIQGYRNGIADRIDIDTTEKPVSFAREMETLALAPDVDAAFVFDAESWEGILYVKAGEVWSHDLKCKGFKVKTEAGSGKLRFEALG